MNWRFWEKSITHKDEIDQLFFKSDWVTNETLKNITPRYGQYILMLKRRGYDIGKKHIIKGLWAYRIEGK